MWVYNSQHGSWSMEGWLYVQGCWSCCITWHAVDLNPDESHILEARDNQSIYYWSAYLWRWSDPGWSDPGGWYHAPLLNTQAEHALVEKWMVHEENVHEDWLTRLMSGPICD